MTVLKPNTRRGAVISSCGKYRYWLERVWDDDKPLLGWIMLNPSTADAQLDDPTIRRCAAFAEREGCGGIVVVNLFAYRSHDPHRIVIPMHPDRVNESYWLKARASCAQVVAAWGAMGGPGPEAHDVVRMFPDLKCLGYTKETGQPRHPLYVRSDEPLVPFPPTKEQP